MPKRKRQPSEAERKSPAPTSRNGSNNDLSSTNSRGSLIIGGILVFLFVAGAIADMSGFWSGIQGVFGRVLYSQQTLTPVPTPQFSLREPEIPPKFGLLNLGRMAFYAPDAIGNNQIYIADIFGTSVQDIYQLTTSKGTKVARSFSPDGNRIAFASTQDGNWEVYIAAIDDDTKPINITNSPNSGDAFPVWSPDGDSIAFTSDREGDPEIYILNLETNAISRLTNNKGEDRVTSWSQNGRIAFHSSQDGDNGNTEIYTINENGTEQQRLTNNAWRDESPKWSPSGETIAFTSNRDGNFEVYLMNADGTLQENITVNPGLDYGATWHPNKEYLAFNSDRDGSTAIYILLERGTIPIRLDMGQDIQASEYNEPLWLP